MAIQQHNTGTAACALYINTTSLDGINDILKKSSGNIFILTDENTGQHCLPLLKDLNVSMANINVISMPSGEINKTLDTAGMLWRQLMQLGADRHSLLINLGGGVVTDMGGFVASLYKRGITFINIPTSLLAMVDAAFGGKTGVDFEGIKNQVGVFSYPAAVYVYPPFLKTLPKRQLLNGYAELIKTALIADAAFFDELADKEIPDILAGVWEYSAGIIKRAIDIKSNIVQKDPKEKGLRKLLNFGHSIGHAVESYSLKNDTTPLLHGEAIAIGMICEARLSNKLNGFPAKELQKVITYLKKTFPSYSLTGKETDILGYMGYDKKNKAGSFRPSLLSSIGKADYDIECSSKEVLEAIEYSQSL